MERLVLGLEVDQGAIIDVKGDEFTFTTTFAHDKLPVCFGLNPKGDFLSVNGGKIRNRLQACHRFHTRR